MSLAKYLARAKALSQEYPNVSAGIGSGLGFMAAINGVQAIKKIANRKGNKR